MVQEVGHGVRFTTHRGTRKALAITFIVETDEIGMIEHPPRDDTGAPRAIADNPTNGTNHSGEQGVVAADVPVVLNDAEHSKYIWATKAVVEKQVYNDDRLTFVSDDMKQLLLQAFELQQHIMEAKMSIHGSA